MSSTYEMTDLASPRTKAKALSEDGMKGSLQILRSHAANLGVTTLSEFEEKFSCFSDEICERVFKEMGVELEPRLKLLKLLRRLRIEAEEMPNLKEEHKWVTRVPVLNLVYEVFFDESPDIEEIKGLLDVVGLLAALLLTIGIALPASLDSETYNEVLDQFNDGGTYGDCEFDGEWIISRFNWYMTNSVVCSLSALAITLIQYLMVATAGNMSPETLDGWWFWARFPIVISIFMLIVAAADSTNAWRFMVVMLMPNIYLLNPNNSCEGFATLNELGLEVSGDPENTWGYTAILASVLSNASIVSAVIFMSLATRAKFDAIEGRAIMRKALGQEKLKTLLASDNGIGVE